MSQVKPWGHQLFVAIVFKVKSEFESGLLSSRERGDWACFVGITQEKATERALAAAEAWERGGGKAFGYYQILTGELTAIVERAICTRNITFEELLAGSDPIGSNDEEKF